MKIYKLLLNIHKNFDGTQTYLNALQESTYFFPKDQENVEADMNFQYFKFWTTLTNPIRIFRSQQKLSTHLLFIVYDDIEIFFWNIERRLLKRFPILQMSNW